METGNEYFYTSAFEPYLIKYELNENGAHACSFIYNKKKSENIESLFKNTYIRIVLHIHYIAYILYSRLDLF